MWWCPLGRVSCGTGPACIRLGIVRRLHESWVLRPGGRDRDVHWCRCAAGIASGALTFQRGASNAHVCLQGRRRAQTLDKRQSVNWVWGSGEGWELFCDPATLSTPPKMLTSRTCTAMRRPFTAAPSRACAARGRRPLMVHSMMGGMSPEALQKAMQDPKMREALQEAMKNPAVSAAQGQGAGAAHTTFMA